LLHIIIDYAFFSRLVDAGVARIAGLYGHFLEKKLFDSGATVYSPTG
jgi:hypothetical protein